MDENQVEEVQVPEQPETVDQPSEQVEEKEPETLEDAMFAKVEEEPDADTEGNTAEPKEGEAANPDEPKEEAKPNEAPAETDPEFTEPEGLSQKASERFRALANEVKELRADQESKQADLETYNTLRSIATESTNNPEEVVQLFDYAKSIKTQDWDKAEHYLRAQISQFEAYSGRKLSADLLSQNPDLRERVESMELSDADAQEIARARFQQQQQQNAIQQQQLRQQSIYQQQMLAQQRQREAQAIHEQAVQDVNQLAIDFAKNDPLWPEYEAKVIEFAKGMVSKLPPEQWGGAIQTYYAGIKSVASQVRQPATAPLRSGAKSGGNPAPQSMQEAMFGSGF